MLDKDPTGRFYAGDGHPAQPVTLIETRDHLEIRDSMALLVAAWAWRDIITHRREGSDAPFRYTCRLFPGQRVETHDPGFLPDRLSAEEPHPAPAPPPFPRAPSRRAPPTERRPRRRWRWPSLQALGRAAAVALGTLLVGAILGALAMALPGLANRLAAFVPVSTERAWGEAMVSDLRDHGLLLCRDIHGSQALERLVTRIAAPMAPPWPIHVQVVKSDRAQILTLPGGRIILFAGLVNEIRTPDEIAGLLAHAIAHGVLRHGTKSLIARHGLPALVALSRENFAAPALSLAAFLAQRDANLADELMADALAQDALRAAGLRGHGLPLALRWMETRPVDMAPLGRSGLTLAPQQALHPPYPERLSALRRTPRGGEEAMDPFDWDSFRLICQ